MFIFFETMESTISESQRAIEGILAGGKVERLPDGPDPVHLSVVEPEQWVAGRGEEVVVFTGDEGVAVEMGVCEDIRLEGVDAWDRLVLFNGGGVL